jgi:hypothetical protein
MNVDERRSAMAATVSCCDGGDCCDGGEGC